MLKQVIFYGAGEHSTKILGSSPTIKEVPQPPPIEFGVCFVDSDQKKHGTFHLGLPVLSLEIALTRFPEAYIYLTMSDMKSKYDVCCYLEGIGFEAGRIINLTTYRLSCPYLENFIVCGHHEGAFDGKAGQDGGIHSLKSCCSDYGKNNVEFVPIHDSLSDAFDDFLTLRSETIRKLNSGEHTKCNGCQELKKLYTLAKPHFTYVIYNELGRCNFKCSYCNFEERLGRDTSTDADLVELLKLVQNYGFDNDNGVVELCSGEITIHPRKKEIYNAVKDNNVMFLTNGLVFDEEIQKKLQNGMGILNLSIDAGTRDTFKKVKGVDAFDRVTENLRRYAHDRQGDLYLKYIVMPGINDNFEDVDGFVNLCIELKVSSAHISHNLCLSYEDYANEQVASTVNHMIDRLRANSIPFEMYSKNIINNIVGI